MIFARRRPFPSRLTSQNRTRVIPMVPEPTLLFTLGRPFSPIYAGLMKLRAYGYQKNILTTYDTGIPVISVGNLTMGGSGKTPLVSYIAHLLQKAGWRPAIISRGYRGSASGRVNIVSDGTHTLLDAVQSGDEPYLLARTLKNVVVATSRKRVDGCRTVKEQYGCNVIILDDGFQHLGVARKLDLVLFDVQHFAGNSRVFPGGDLREPISALQRASAFVLTGATEQFTERAKKCRELLTERFPDKPVFTVSREYSGARLHGPSGAASQDGQLSLADLPDRLFCFCGIARPQRFLESLEEHAITVSGSRFFPDHHFYGAKDIQELHEAAEHAGAPGFITTEKDMTKIPQLADWGLPLYTARLEIPRNPSLDDYITSGLEH